MTIEKLLKASHMYENVKQYDIKKLPKPSMVSKDKYTGK
ncbi:hypothetical protein BT3_214 [Staphylococcus phage BT3]|uniref:Uncharacterized protein n=2 Tax=Kayvirus TaxID=1857843 RepID=A0A8E5K8I4_9CAUD|nr:hypothetical protein OZ71_gp192 [Staphylococcus phage MCE-2014]QVD56220.1 hypothetical protein PM9_207 [Staphylococcus phage PM9]QVD56447.1 hypothetical protein PM22_202 [Staphylococcus phage PM22]QVD56562.1 hypothetical protein PM25_105 [Staphylococcus phage PM25]QVD56688.1 hypothetical protein PM28_018 [Staphylococcus phage PM28]QVD57526.1 hypothetical protein PM32_212 [Staphylococcus phage PM32]QVD58175.1 hypothetical protein BT3_214 [Staphylococcus phage BT3]QVD58401.1 hypothetical pr